MIIISKKASLITVNDTGNPKTGGDRVYRTIKEVLLEKGYNLCELSTPMFVDYLTRGSSLPLKNTFAEIMAYCICCFGSILDFSRQRRLVITSSSPIFPAFGHLIYHQPKAGLFTSFREKNISLTKKVGYKIMKNEDISPIWKLSKKLVLLHLSNSQFTKEWIKKHYGIESQILYPPVSIPQYNLEGLLGKKSNSILIARPTGLTGISLLPDVAKNLSKDLTFQIIGSIDQVGVNTLSRLKKDGVSFNYLGYVDEKLKRNLFQECSMYLNLSINEPFGITIVEAMASGCIPLAHKSGGVIEYMPPELTFSTPKEAAEKIKMYLDGGYTLRKRLRGISQRFTVKKFKKKFRRLISSLHDQI